MDTRKIIEENERRLKYINRPHNPLTGEGCDAVERVKLSLSDCPYPVMYIPRTMYDKVPICKKLEKSGSIKSYLSKKTKQTITDEIIMSFFIEFSMERINYDFEFYAYTHLTIRDKTSALDIPFSLNRGQCKLLRELERMRILEVPIRLILLKARQWGGSTLIQLYMFWIQNIHRKNWNSVICAHLNDAAKNIRGMYSNALDHYPSMNGEKPKLTPFEGAQNIKILEGRGCKITVGSAESPNSVRSQDVKLAHFSEVGLYPSTPGNKPEDLVSSISGTVTRDPYTMIVYESTAKGIGNFFHTQWLKATSDDPKIKSAFTAVFVEWFEIDIYTEEIKIPIEKFIISMTEYEWTLWRKGATLQAINWYRGKKGEIADDSTMKEEFPSDDIEAFQNSGQPVFNTDHVEKLREECCNPEVVGEISGQTSASEAKLKPELQKKVLQNLVFTPSAKGCLKIWAFPDHQKILHRYVVVVDTGGRSRKADYSVITVFDRYWMMHGGKPEIAAQWRGHVDHDVLAWKAAQIAKWYDNALLVFESNTAETENTDGDHTEFIYDTISNHYDNLYSRTPADKIAQGVPAKWGFHTNKSTKPMIIDNYVAILREQGYVERDDEACNEARWYEKKENGSFGAIDGKHDDIIMSRMIGLYICYNMPLPVKIKQEKTTNNKKIVNESTF